MTKQDNKLTARIGEMTTSASRDFPLSAAGETFLINVARFAAAIIGEIMSDHREIYTRDGFSHYEWFFGDSEEEAIHLLLEGDVDAAIAELEDGWGEKIK